MEAERDEREREERGEYVRDICNYELTVKTHADRNHSCLCLSIPSEHLFKA